MPVYALGDIAPKLPADGGVWIAPDAHVIGDVTLAEGVGVWFGAVLRGDNEPIVVGRNTNVQDGAVLHTDPGLPLTIGDGCTIGHRAIVHGCTIGDGCLIGMGATVMNGAEIGAGSVVGANALVTENMVFPAGSLILGAPARAARALDADAPATLARSAQVYADNAKRFRTTLRRLD